MRPTLVFIVLFLVTLMAGCAARGRVVIMETTSYCNCRQCCDWERGFPDLWNKYVSAGSSKGKSYSGLTASGTKPRTPHPGLFSWDSLVHPWMIPIRIVFFPWLLLPQDGTLAADTKYYPFGTRMHIPGYGYGVVADRGGAIKGPRRLDLYQWSHSSAIAWGRRKKSVTIYSIQDN